METGLPRIMAEESFDLIGADELASGSANKAPIAQTPVEKPEPRLYRVIWRWHFYAGLIVMPVLVIAALTGGLYVFKEEIEEITNARTLMVTPQSQRASFDKQLANAKAVAPADSHANAIFIHNNPARATEFTFHTRDDRYFYVFVNQHNGVVQGSHFYGDTFFDIVLKIHRQLFAGTIGRVIVELATSWGIILVGAGLYLWWPRRRDKVLGVWLPRLRGKSYLVWRDWHVVPGFYISLIAALVMATGLFFTLLFGRGYQWMAYNTKSYPASYFNPPKSAQREGATRVTLDEVIAIAKREQGERQMYVSFPREADDSFSIFAGNNDSPSTLSQLYIDQYSGKVLETIRWRQLSTVAKVQLSAYPIHIGSIYGLPTKILALLACLLIVAMSVTGAAMWWVRRPKGQSGFPSKPGDFKTAKWLIAVICLFGALMPASGISILLILLGDWALNLWRRRAVTELPDMR